MMKRIWGISLFAAALALTWTLAGCGDNQEQTATPADNAATIGTATNATNNTANTPATIGAALGTAQMAGPFQVTLTAEPKVGETRFRVKVTRDGKAIQDAAVKLSLSMPTMNMGGPTVTLKPLAPSTGGYQSTADLSMGGAWQAKVLVSAAGASGTAIYNFTVGQ